MYCIDWRLLGYFACGEGPIYAVLQKVDSETSERIPAEIQVILVRFWLISSNLKRLCCDDVGKLLMLPHLR
jgi:lantibiotic modifying enzyme